MRLRSSKIIPTRVNNRVNVESYDTTVMFCVVCFGYIVYVTVIFFKFFRENCEPEQDEKFNLSSILEDMI
jgi:hypothetical protein